MRDARRRDHQRTPPPNASSILAWSTVRGKPSSINPLEQSLSSILSLMMPTTISSPTSPPASMTAFAFWPTSLPAATAALNMSPVESWGAPSLSTSFGACVPLPLPGGPKRMTTWRASPPPACIRVGGRRPWGGRLKAVVVASNAMLRSCMVSLLLVCALYAATAMRLQQGMFVIAANAILWLDPRLLRVI